MDAILAQGATDQSEEAIRAQFRNASGGYECRNGEEVDADLVITRLALSVRDGSFGEYSRCNICVRREISCRIK